MKRACFLISILLISLVSCQKGGDILNTCLSIQIQSKDGADLLNPASEGAIIFPFLDVYRLEDGIKTKQHQGITISRYEESDRYKLQICIDLAPVKIENGKFTYILEYKDRQPDTITGKRHAQGGVISLEDVRVNGVLFPQDDVLIIKSE